MSQSYAMRLDELGIVLPEAPLPAANYLPAVLEGGLLHISGQLPIVEGKLTHSGKLGADLGIEDGQEAARICAINIMAQAKAALGDLERVRRVVKIGAFVASTPDFTDQPQVVNGASNLIADVFGEAGKHARFAVGVAALPFDAAVEIEALLAVHDAETPQI